MNEIINIDGHSLEMTKKLHALQMQVQTLELCRQLGAHYAATDMVPKQYQGKPESAAVAIQWGMEIGLQPLQSLQNVAVVNGNPTLWGDALIAVVKGSGLCEYIRTEFDEDTMTAFVATKRKGEPSEEVRSYSLEDAKRAGLLNRQTYQQHAKRMLTARARSHVLRDVYADLLKGFQAREIAEEDHAEEKDITPKKSSTLASLLKPKAEKKEKPAAIEQPKSQVEEMLGMVADAATMTSLDAIVGRIKSATMTDDERETVRHAWKSKRDSIHSAMEELF